MIELDTIETQAGGPEPIKTFSQALPILAVHNIVPESIGNHLWRVGSMQYDKGGIVALAREYQARPATPAAPIELEDVQALATAEQPIVGVPMMDASEARSHLEMMRTEIDMADRAIGNFRQRAAEFTDREGWRALGYSGAAEAINAELGTQYSKSYLSRLLKAAEIERVLELPIGNSVPESVLRPLAQLDSPDQQRAAYQAAATNGTPTAAKVQQAADEIAGVTPADLLKAGIQLTKHGAWFQATGFSGELNGWTTGRAMSYQSTVNEARQEIQRRAKAAQMSGAINRPDGSPAPARVLSPETSIFDRMIVLCNAQDWAAAQALIDGLPSGAMGARKDLAATLARAQQQAEQPPAAPDLADILKRLDAHGYAKVSTREKGMTTFYLFRNYASDLGEDETGEIELAEGELPLWLAELDSKAAYAREKQERFIDARDRADRLGYDLTRDGARFVLTPAGQKVPAMHGTLDQLEKTIAGYEKNAAKQAAAAAPALTIEQLDALGMPVDLHNAGYYWVSATPPTIARNGSNWRGDGQTVEQAIEVARTHMQAKGEPISISLSFTPLEWTAIIRESKMLIGGGGDKKVPTICQMLRVAARMALEATE